MRKLILFGIGKIGQVAYHHFSTDSDYQVAAFATDAAYIPKDGHYEGLPMVDFADIEKQFPPQEHDMFIAVGYQDLNQLRAGRCADAKRKGYKLASYISSQNTHMRAGQVGENSFVMSGEPVQPQARVGDNCFIWTNAIVGHHAQIGNHCWVTSGVVIGGNSRVGDCCFLGLGATIGHEITIGNHSLIGAGALITKDAPENSVYIASETPRFRLTSQQFMKMTTMK